MPALLCVMPLAAANEVRFPDRRPTQLGERLENVPCIMQTSGSSLTFPVGLISVPNPLTNNRGYSS